MNDEHPSTSPQKSWLERLSQAFSGAPSDRTELVEILRGARENDLIDADTLTMLEGAMSVSDTQVRDVMVPRMQLVMLQRDAPIRDILQVVVESGHSRFPVIGDDPDDVIGLLLAKDLLHLFLNESIDDGFGALVRPAMIIPESKRLNVLLKDFRQSRNHMAIVVDEYGGVAGLVTIEDVLEQIVGEIDDEHDTEEDAERNIVQQSEGLYAVRALTPIEEFNESFAHSFPDEDYDTIGGLITHELGRLPERGESLQLGPFEFTVVEVDSRRPDLLEMRVLAAPGE